VFNLLFPTELLERVVQVRLQSLLDNSAALPRNQSAYRRWHSTETTLVKVFNDFLMAADGSEVSVLSLSGLTTALDTVDHQLQVRHLKHNFGVIGRPLEWV
jgi:hypothetical protein